MIPVDAVKAPAAKDVPDRCIEGIEVAADVLIAADAELQKSLSVSV
ncbi:hypothetical protein [Mycolicibacterium sp. 018/SC-01/001]|nr:hypothetical protein [Mycolicibacterium sp. 018/SC-01/001]